MSFRTFLSPESSRTLSSWTIFKLLLNSGGLLTEVEKPFLKHSAEEIVNLAGKKPLDGQNITMEMSRQDKK